MRKQTLLTVAVIGLLILNFVILALFFFDGRKPPLPPLPHVREPRAEKIIEERLKLSEQQRIEFEILKKEHLEKMKDVNNEERRLHDELFGLLKGSQQERINADSLISLIAENKKTAEQITFSHFSDIKNLCSSDEQKKLYDEFIGELGKMIGPPEGREQPPLPPVR